MLRTVALCLFLALAETFAQIAGAQTPSAVSAADARAIRAVIEAQLDAFKRDDAARAFSYAAPGIRATFGTAENFVAMVKNDYPVVYRPSAVAFESPVVVGQQVVQPVRFTDAQGGVWLALYPMQRLKDGTWRIDGCYLQRFSGQQT